MKTLVAGLCGLVFGAGLAISGMTNPAKVQAFLDVFGAWDPTLAFVMGGALAVSAAGYQAARRRERAWLGDAFGIPTRRDLDGSLVGGAALFGVGWGLVGLCPGPALANLFRGSSQLALFVAAMLAGMLLYRGIARAATEAPRELERAR
ncbi:MAG TPA: DUF6691 family protein [Myxococcota bacterium]|nr:DUF6691 family protein [Myxococcota bacterium]